MPYEITLERESHPDDDNRQMVTGACITGLPAELFGEAEFDLFVEETADGKFACETQHGEHAFGTVVDAVLASVGELWRGHPVPEFGDGDEFVLIDGSDRHEFVARHATVIRKEYDK